MMSLDLMQLLTGIFFILGFIGVMLYILTVAVVWHVVAQHRQRSPRRNKSRSSATIRQD